MCSGVGKVINWENVIQKCSDYTLGTENISTKLTPAGQFCHFSFHLYTTWENMRCFSLMLTNWDDS